MLTCFRLHNPTAEPCSCCISLRIALSRRVLCLHELQRQQWMATACQCACEMVKVRASLCGTPCIDTSQALKCWEHRVLSPQPQPNPNPTHHPPPTTQNGNNTPCTRSRSRVGCRPGKTGRTWCELAAGQGNVTVIPPWMATAQRRPPIISTPDSRAPAAVDLLLLLGLHQHQAGGLGGGDVVQIGVKIHEGTRLVRLCHNPRLALSSEPGLELRQQGRQSMVERSGQRSDFLGTAPQACPLPLSTQLAARGGVQHLAPTQLILPHVCVHAPACRLQRVGSPQLLARVLLKVVCIIIIISSSSSRSSSGGD